MAKKHGSEHQEEEKVVEKTEVERLRDTLIFLRDNVVHGSEKYIQMIDRALNG